MQTDIEQCYRQKYIDRQNERQTGQCRQMDRQRQTDRTVTDKQTYRYTDRQKDIDIKSEYVEYVDRHIDTLIARQTDRQCLTSQSALIRVCSETQVVVLGWASL